MNNNNAPQQYQVNTGKTSAIKNWETSLVKLNLQSNVRSVVYQLSNTSARKDVLQRWPIYLLESINFDIF